MSFAGGLAHRAGPTLPADSALFRRTDSTGDCSKSRPVTISRPHLPLVVDNGEPAGPRYPVKISQLLKILVFYILEHDGAPENREIFIHPSPIMHIIAYIIVHNLLVLISYFNYAIFLYLINTIPVFGSI